MRSLILYFIISVYSDREMTAYAGVHDIWIEISFLPFYGLRMPFSQIRLFAQISLSVTLVSFVTFTVICPPWVTRQMLHAEPELLTLPEHMCLPPFSFMVSMFLMFCVFSIVVLVFVYVFVYFCIFILWSLVFLSLYWFTI